VWLEALREIKENEKFGHDSRFYGQESNLVHVLTALLTGLLDDQYCCGKEMVFVYFNKVPFIYLGRISPSQ
jgi:hypothetical protein